MNQLATHGATRTKASDILGERRIEHVVVLGANGTMGFGSGALFTHAVPKVTFLARSKAKAEDGLKAAIRQVRSPTVADRVECGSYEEDLERAVGSADLIFEAVTEQLELKQQFFERIDRARRPDSIVGTVTSGLSINKLAEGRSDSFRKHFMGIHFFNPPNVIVGTELVAGKDTDPALLDFVVAAENDHRLQPCREDRRDDGEARHGRAAQWGQRSGNPAAAALRVTRALCASPISARAGALAL